MWCEHLFVYGTLRRQVGHPMHRTLLAYAELRGAGRLAARLYDLGDYPGATPAADADAWVHGEIYRIRDARLLPLLDEYEECSARFPRPHEYVRQVQHLHAGNGRRLRAWVYLLNRKGNDLRQIPCGDYLQDLRERRRVEAAASAPDEALR